MYLLKTFTMFYFSQMAQELELVPKDPNYINPYRLKAQKEKQVF